MNITCNTKELYRAVKMVSRAVGTRDTLNLIRHAKFETSGLERLTIAGTNMIVGMTTAIAVTAEKPALFTVDARLLAEYLGTLTADVTAIAFDLKKLAVNVKSGGNTATFKSIEPNDLPIVRTIGTIDCVNECFVDAAAFRTAILQTERSAAKDESRPVLAGICLQACGNVLHLAAADGFRLANARVDLSGDPVPDFTRIIPVNSMRELATLLDGATDPVRIALNAENDVIAVIGETQFSMRTIDGTFPDFEQIVPQSFNISTLIDRRETLTAIRRSRTFFGKEDSLIAVDLQKNGDGDRIVISTIQTQNGQADSLIDAEITGPPIRIVLGANYLADAIDVIDTSRAWIGLNQINTPMVIRAEGEGGSTHVLMPAVIPQRVA